MALFKSTIQPFCRNCGKPIRKNTERHYLKQKDITSKVQCEALTNQRVINVRYDQEQGGERYIRAYDTWDGETYMDPHFCKLACAAVFARAVVRHQNLGMPAYHEAMKRQREKQGG